MDDVDFRKKRDLQGSDDEDEDNSELKELKVQFGVGFNEDIGQKLLTKKEAKQKDAKKSDFEKWQDKKAQIKKDKKRQAKERTKEKQKEGRMTEAELVAYQKEKAQLEMLIDSSKSRISQAKPVGDDSRFITSDKAYTVDPTHKEYKKVVQGHNKVQKRQSGQHVHSHKHRQ